MYVNSIYSTNRPSYCLAIALFFSISCIAQKAATTDPTEAKFITSDIANFWIMFDSLPSASSRQDSLNILQSEYLAKASKGLQRYFSVEEQENGRKAEDIQAAYLDLLASAPKYLASIREATLSVESRKPEIMATFDRLRTLYPDFTFPDAYFGIGFMNTGARSFVGGEMYIGAEIFAVSDTPDYAEFPEDFWLKNLAAPAEDLYQILAHEYTHGQQQLPPPGSNDLLALTLMEGGAVFLAAVATDGESLIGGAGVNQRAFAFGETYEAEVWQKFQSDLEDGNTSAWFYNAETEDFPRDMGYYVGFKICQSYYQHAEDKQQAILRITEMKDYDAFLAESRYGKEFE